MMLPNRLAQPLRTALTLAALGVTLAAAHALGQTLTDPTRPPNLADPEPRTAKAPRAPALAASVAAPPVLPRLLAVQVAENAAASSALVDGRVVRVGDRLADAAIVAIDRAGLTLRGPRGEQRLPLLSGITQTASRAAPPVDAALATGTSQDTRP